MGVARHKSKRPRERLGDEETVERVGVERRQLFETRRMFFCNRQKFISRTSEMDERFGCRKRRRLPPAQGPPDLEQPPGVGGQEAA